MAYNEQMGTANIRTTFYDKMVKQIAAQVYKFKQAVTIIPTSAWKLVFYREDPTVAAGGTGNSTRGLPRGAEFPRAIVAWEQVKSTIEKYGLEQDIFWEDILSDDIDVRNRTLIKIAAGVARSVDDAIWDGLTESRVPVNIQTFRITNGYCWDTASAAIIDNLEQAEQLIATQNYDTSNLLVYVSPLDKRKIVNYLYEKGAQAPRVAERMIDGGNGVIGTLGNKTFIVSNSVTASFALVVVPKICGNWKELSPLQTVSEEHPGKNVVIRSFEYGQVEVTDPKAVVLIANTQT